jgi:hypothetical protein
MYTFAGTSTDETFTFTASEPPAIDAALTEITTWEFLEIGDVSITGEIKNLGTTTINSFDLSYSIDNGAPVSENISGLNLTPFTEYVFDHTALWTASTAATYSVKVWVDNVNGAGADDDASNNTKTLTVTIIEPTPNIIASYTSDTTALTHQVIGSASDQLDEPQDLDFHMNGELWIINRGTANSGGSTVTFTDPGGTGQTSVLKTDQNAKHFMNQPTGIAFSMNGNFATSPGVYDANFDGGAPFTGPSLWDADPLVYAQPSGGNGSHIDMLHASSFAMGIAHETANVFWVFDGNNNDIVRYDFADDHGPGNSYHDDGKVRRFTGMSVSRIDDIIGSHMELHKSSGWLYIVDNGNQRVLRLDINSGTVGGTPSYGPYETLEEYKEVNGATWETVVDSGLVQPSGLDVIDDRMIVTDHSTGDIIIYDITAMPAVEVKRIATGNPGIMGTVLGPEGRIWYVNYLTNEVIKIEPSDIIVPPPAVSIKAPVSKGEFQLYPNPSTGFVTLRIGEVLSREAVVRVQDMFGKTVFESGVKTGSMGLDLSDCAAGVYMISLEDNGSLTTERLVIQ